MNAFEALADSTRREILCLLEQGPMEMSEIADKFAISKPAVSKHLKRLREGELVTRTVDAQRRIYQLNPVGLREIEHWTAARRRAWESRVDQLELYLAKKHGRSHPRSKQ